VEEKPKKQIKAQCIAAGDSTNTFGNTI